MHPAMRYAERHFLRSGRSKFPTVRQVARACRLRQHEIEQICEETGAACLQGYNIEGWKLGDLEVYVYDHAYPVNIHVDR